MSEVRTWNDVTRSTEEEHQRFMQALKKFTFTREEFLEEGPEVIMRKHKEFMEALDNYVEYKAEDSKVPSVQEGDSDK